MYFNIIVINIGLVFLLSFILVKVIENLFKQYNYLYNCNNIK